MFGIDAPELLVIAAVALIFIGPKELPGMLRTIGRWVATARNMAGEFRGHVDDMMRQAELDELKKQVEAGTKDAVLDLQGLDPTREIKSALEEGASDAQKEMEAARASIEASTAETPPPTPVTSADLAVSGDPAPAMLPTGADAPPVEPEFAAVPPASEAAPVAVSEAAPPPASEPAPAVPAAANEPAAPQKVAVG